MQARIRDPRRGRIAWWFAGGFAVALSLGFWRSTGHSGDHVTPLPVILKEVQGLGELRTSSYTYQNVVTYATHREPAEWAASLPVVPDLVRSSTANEALVSLTGSVQAGFDLSKAEIFRSSSGLVVKLPEPTIYPALVDGHVHRHHSGLAWRDANIGLKATRDAAQRFRLASQQQGIEGHAKREAGERLRSLIAKITDEPVKIEFPGQAESI